MLEGRLHSRQCQKIPVCVSMVVMLGTCQTGKASQELALASQASLRTRQEQLSFVDLEGDPGSCLRAVDSSLREGDPGLSSSTNCWRYSWPVRARQPDRESPTLATLALLLRSRLPWFWQAAHSLRRLPLSLLCLKASRGLERPHSLHPFSCGLSQTSIVNSAAALS